ncbi:MAG: c-type cytochrome, partial [Candidatus Binatia bacterium]
MAAGSTEEADIRRALTLLNVVGEEYREGVVDGQIVLPVEYDEALAFLTEAEARLRSAAPPIATASEARFAALRTAITGLTPLSQVRGGLDELRAQVSSASGVTEQVFPGAAPSASRGRELFAENCVACHGERADGRGAEAARLSPPPANFGDAAFMGRETPFDFFHIVTVGKGTSAMPAWGDVLSLQERWDLVSYLWTVQPGAAGLAEGQGVYVSA